MGSLTDTQAITSAKRGAVQDAIYPVQLAVVICD